MPWYLRPVLDALLALTIDLSMDAIAIRLGFWTWGAAGPWFGVPLSNFYVWFVVVLGYSLLVRLGRRWWLAGHLSGLADMAVAILAIALAVTGLIALHPPVSALLTEGSSGWLSISILLGGSLLLVGWTARRTRHDQPLDATVLSTSAFFHLFFLAMLFWSGIFRQVPALIVIAASVFVISSFLHLWPVWDELISSYTSRPQKPAP